MSPTSSTPHEAGNANTEARSQQRSQNAMSANIGPAQIAAHISGVEKKAETKEDPYFTNADGIPWPNPSHSKNIGGIPLISDPFLLQKQQTFNRSKNLERMVHPCGSGAFGYFETTKDISHLTKAKFLQPGKKTPIFTRFSTVTLGREFPDSARNPRGFAVKFYTEEGNHDIVGLNWPIFFCRDPIQGPDVIRSQSRSPKNFLLDYNALFDLLGQSPEANHAGLMFFSDHGTPVGWRYEHGYGCHTFKLVNEKGEFVYIKWHFRAEHGQKQFTMAEATKMCGEDPDYSKRDLWDTIEKGEEIVWKVAIQTMQPNDADPDTLGFDPFDVTKVWPRTEFPMQEVGRLVLNKNPENFHRDVEQAAFSPGAMVPGIEDSPDPLLQFRSFFYRDAQYHRIGVNLHQTPVNCPFMAQSYDSLNFDGPMRNDSNHGDKPQYVPNSFAHKFRPDVAEAPYAVSDNIVSRGSHYYHECKRSEYTQATYLYERVMDDKARENTQANTAKLLSWVTYPHIQRNYLIQAHAISPELAKGIFDLLEGPKLEFKEIEEGSKQAEFAGKDPKFRAKHGMTLQGKTTTFSPYNIQV